MTMTTRTARVMRTARGILGTGPWTDALTVDWPMVKRVVVGTVEAVEGGVWELGAVDDGPGRTAVKRWSGSGFSVEDNDEGLVS